MTYSAWKTRVLSYLDVDATRRGIEPLRDGFIKGAVADLKHFVPAYQDNRTSYVDSEEVPFNERAAEAAAMYVKARIVRITEKDLALSASFQADYVLIRRSLVRDSKELETVERDITAELGETIPFEVIMEMTELGEPWTDYSSYLIEFELCGKPGLKLSNKPNGGIATIDDTAYWEIASGELKVGSYRYQVTLTNKDVTPNRKMTLRQGTITVE